VHVRDGPKRLEVLPDGTAYNLDETIKRARYREGYDREVFMQAGEVYALPFEPLVTSNVVKQGHRIRIEVSSSNFPRFDVNPNTGEPLGKNRRMITTDISIQHSATYPSHIVLPIAPVRK
jgi:putative CocE/NonD family hydrolase